MLATNLAPVLRTMVCRAVATVLHVVRVAATFFLQVWDHALICKEHSRIPGPFGMADNDIVKLIGCATCVCPYPSPCNHAITLTMSAGSTAALQGFAEDKMEASCYVCVWKVCDPPPQNGSFLGKPILTNAWFLERLHSYFVYKLLWIPGMSGVLPYHHWYFQQAFVGCLIHSCMHVLASNERKPWQSTTIMSGKGWRRALHDSPLLSTTNMIFIS